MTYTLYRGQTRTGKPRYYLGRPDSGQGDPVTELPHGFTISESVNGVISLAKDRPALIQPEEVATVEAAVQLRANVLPGEYRRLVGTARADGTRGRVGPCAHPHAGYRAVL